MMWPGSSSTATATATHVVDMALFGGPELYRSQIGYLASIRISGNCRTRSPLVPGPNGTWIANPGIYLHRSPTRDVSLRIIDPITFEVVNDSSGGTLLDHVEYGRAFFCLFAVMCGVLDGGNLSLSLSHGEPASCHFREQYGLTRQSSTRSPNLIS